MERKHGKTKNKVLKQAGKEVMEKAIELKLLLEADFIRNSPLKSAISKSFIE